MDREELFIRALRDLDKRTAEYNEYDTLRLAAILRQLLLDGSSLLDEVNRKYRKRIRFRANCSDPGRDSLAKRMADFGQLNWVRLDRLGGVTPPEGKGLPEHTRDQFLACVVLRYRQYEYTVHDLIDYVAHFEGGVHHGTPIVEKMRALYDLAEGTYSSTHFQPGIFALVPLGRVVLWALAELRGEIESSRPDLRLGSQLEPPAPT